MEKQNVTLSIPKHLLQRAKILAIQRNHSLSGMMTEMLRELVEGEERYTAAMQRSFRRMNEARELNGRYSWSRESLHER